MLFHSLEHLGDICHHNNPYIHCNWATYNIYKVKHLTKLKKKNWELKFAVLPTI